MDLTIDPESYMVDMMYYTRPVSYTHLTLPTKA